MGLTVEMCEERGGVSLMRLSWKSTDLGSDYARDWRGGSVQNIATNRPKVLVETEDGAEAIALWRGLGRSGYRMQWCPGPDEEANRRCSLVSGEGCALVEGADVVISHLDFTCDAARETLAALQQSQSTGKVLAAAPDVVRARHPEIEQGVTMLPDQLTSDGVVSAVQNALAPPTERQL